MYLSESFVGTLSRLIVGQEDIFGLRPDLCQLLDTHLIRILITIIRAAILLRRAALLFRLVSILLFLLVHEEVDDNLGHLSLS